MGDAKKNIRTHEMGAGKRFPDSRNFGKVVFLGENMSRVIGVIPARHGSVRFPGKPLVKIEGKTLIQRTFENCKQCESLDEVIVATDDERIADHVASFGGNAVMTSEECRSGSDRVAEAIADLSDVDIVVNIQGDEPNLEPSTIDQIVSLLKEDPQAQMSTAAVLLTSEEDWRRTSVVKCVIDKQGNALYFSRSPIPGGKDGKWDPSVNYYKHLGIYGFRREFLLQYPRLEPTPLQLAEDLEQLKALEHGFKIKVAVVESEAIGIDTPEDIHKLKKLL